MMGTDQLKPLIGRVCVIFVDMKSGKPFRYAGKVLNVTEEFFTILDSKTGNKMTCPLNAIISIIEEGGQQ